MLVQIEKQVLDNLVKKVDELHSGALKNKEASESDWIDGQAVMKTLGISKRTLQKLKSQGLIEYSAVSRKLHFFSKKSVEKLLNRNVYKTFNQ